MSLYWWVLIKYTFKTSKNSTYLANSNVRLLAAAATILHIEIEVASNNGSEKYEEEHSHQVLLLAQLHDLSKPSN